MNRYHRSWAFCLLALLAAGCATGRAPTETIRQHMEKHPEEYRRVEILPIWFLGYAQTDASLTTNDLAALDHQVATNVRTALGWVLAEKGYEIVKANPVVCSDSDLEAFDAETRQLLEQVRTNFNDLSLRLSLNRLNQKTTRLGYTLDDSVTALRKKLSLGEADLLVLMESEAFFESPGEHNKRHKRNRTSGAALMPLFVAFSAAAVAGGGGAGMPNLPLEFSPDWRRYSILIADAHTREVVFWNARKFPGEGARDPDPLKGKLRDTLAELANLPK